MNWYPRALLTLSIMVAAGACTPMRGDDMREIAHLSVFIARPPQDVYDFVADPRNLPLWAAGLASSSVRQDGETWLVDAPSGEARVRFAERNPFGVLDHDVTLASGASVHVPMRVIPHGEGSEFLFTLLRQSGMSDAQFAQDRAAVERDLQTLKRLLERTPRSGS